MVGLWSKTYFQFQKNPNLVYLAPSGFPLLEIQPAFLKGLLTWVKNLNSSLQGFLGRLWSSALMLSPSQAID